MRPHVGISSHHFLENQTTFGYVILWRDVLNHIKPTSASDIKITALQCASHKNDIYVHENWENYFSLNEVNVLKL